MPEETVDVVVLGAGIVGVSTAYAARARGMSVVLIDRREPGSETSYGNAVFGKQRLLLLRRFNRVAAPRLQRTGFAKAMARARLHDPFAVQLRRCADQPAQGVRARLQARRRRIGEKARYPAGVPRRPKAGSSATRRGDCQDISAAISTATDC